MKHRKLRIAWSVAWGIAAVLLIALWALSYWLFNSWQYGTVRLQSMRGRIAIFSTPDWRTWRMSSLPVESVGTDGFEHHIVTGVRRILPNGGVRESIQVSATTSRIATISWPGLPLAAIAVIAVAVFPLLYRFSLRTLLIATTLVAVGLGFMVWAAK